MLRNMKLGTKLLAVILPPLIVLVVVAGIGARDRLDQAADARAAEQYIELAASTSALVTTMQWERNLSMFVLAGGDEGDEFLAERRERTDREVARMVAAVDALDLEAGTSLADLATRSVQRNSELVSFRQSLDAGTTEVWILQSFFDRAIEDHLNVVSEVANTVPVVEVSAPLASFSALTRAKEQAARTSSVYTIALTNGSFDADGRVWRATRDAESGFERYISLFYDISPAELASTMRRGLGSPESQRAEDMRLQVVSEVALTIDIFGNGAAIGEPLKLDFDPKEWIDRSENRLNGVNRVGADILGGVTEYVTDVRTDAEQAALLFLLGTAAAVLLSGILAIVVSRRVTKPLRELTVAADRLSTEQLPALVEQLRSPSASSSIGVTLEPINMGRTDEIGSLADAFDSIQRVTVEVAEEQASLLKKGIGDIFVNLARRNQTLLDRQIEFIDQLESAEEDPDVLEDLFKLDHLATRMRRNAESLLVLAGVETGHRRSRPVPLADVVRVAIGEVEDFARLNLLALDDAMVSGTAAMDIAHMLSELMENATAFSPPETNVEILGHQSPEGYVISISDQGIGMSEEQFAEANRLLAEPPLVGLTLSRSLGFTVVGRLASRFNVSVRLTSSPTGGVTALVTLPHSVLQEAQITVTPDVSTQAAAPAPVEATPAEAAPAEMEPAPAAQATVDPYATPTLDDVFAEPERAPEPVLAAPETPVLNLDPDPAFAEADEVAETVSDATASDETAPPAAPPAVVDQPAPDWVAPAPAASSLASAVPEGDAFDAGLAALIGDESAADQSPAQPEPAAPSIFSDAAMGEETPTQTDELTASGLVRRVPRANIPAEEHTERPGASSVAASQRSPEEVRAMLSRYRSGLQRAGQSGDGPGSGSDSDGSN